MAEAYDPPENPYLDDHDDDDENQEDYDDEEGSENDDPAGEEDLGDDDDEDDDDDPMMHLPEYVLKRVEKLKELSSARDAIMEEYMKERAALEQRFAAQVEPLYEERQLIVSGEMDHAISQEAGVKPDPEDEPEVLNGVPHFWVTCLSNHESTGEIIQEYDVDCLESLKDVKCTDDADGKGFELTFYFTPNDYFHDTVLTKRYEVPNLALPDEPMIKSVKGCSIQWKDDDHNLTQTKVQKRQRGKGKRAGQVRTITKLEKKESFFHWFEAPNMPTNEQVETLDEEEVDAIEQIFSDDFDIAQAFRSELIPNAVGWYTGEANEQMMMELMEAASALEESG
mmetsp:Transcript_10287/g.28372  ORF Transcript_10287/g.28372 Transcript_10287/m.28372 type:complete len:339 (-) Transcript_10287:112-1128(-)